MKILVLGYFGNISNKLDGQTVKTRSIYELLRNKSSDEILFFDTEILKFNKFKFVNLIKQLCFCHRLVYLPAHGNLKYLFPFLYFFSLLFRFQIIYIVIGGWLVEYLKSKPLHRYLLKRIKVICPETKRMKLDLENNYSFQNIVILPNFRKNYSIKNTLNYNVNTEKKLRLVFMARIQQMKGLDYIKDLAEYIIQEKREDMFMLDFYGQIDKSDNLYFKDLITKYSFLHYKGALLPQEIYTTLSQYDLLVLPTHYYTEGLPGSILDAYIAGIPVLVTKWKHACEFVEDNITGFIIPFNDSQKDFIRIIDELILDKSKLALMKIAAKKKSYSYSEGNVWNIIYNLLQKK